MNVSMTAMESSSEMQAGSYVDSFFFKIFLNWVDSKFPGSRAIIEAAAAALPWSKLVRAVTNALADWREGKSFTDILKEALQEWGEVETTPDGIRFTAKAE